MIFTGTSCKKFLQEKSVKSYTIPEKVSDLQALLDYYPYLNTTDPPAGELSNGDYYLTDANWLALFSDYERRIYSWEKSNIFEPENNDWLYSYMGLNVANTVLDNINKVDAGIDPTQLNSVRGQALFFRAKIFLQLVVIFSPAYDPNTNGDRLGLPLRLNSNFNEVSVRASVHQTYEQIVNDLKAAIPGLPISQVSPLRPSKAAAYGLLARTLLLKREYKQAGLYADSCLRLNNKLIDFNTLNSAATYPIPKLNAEVIFESSMPASGPLNASRAMIDPDLYRSYEVNDIRKTVFFRNNNNGTFAFKGSYEGASSLFTGIATNEMYLTRAECFAREGKVVEALSYINLLLKNRWRGTYQDLISSNQEEVLTIILTERRKELLMRGLNWCDVKRLNLEGRNIKLSRTIQGNTKTLEPNDSRYSLAIPEDVISLSGLNQNP